MIQVYKEQLEKLAKDATKEIREEIKQSKEKVERQAKKLKKELSKLKKVIEAPSAALGTVCGGVKSAISFVKDSGKKVGTWFSNLLGKRRKKRNACGIPAIVPNVDINAPNIDLDAMKDFLKNLAPDIDLVDFDFDQISEKFFQGLLILFFLYYQSHLSMKFQYSFFF